MNQQLTTYYDYVEVETIETYTVIQQTFNQYQVQETFIIIILITALVMIIVGFILGFICSKKISRFQINQIIYRIYHHCIPDFIIQILNSKHQIETHLIPPKPLNPCQSSQQDNIQTEDYSNHSIEDLNPNQSQIQQLSFQQNKKLSQNIIQQSNQNYTNKNQDQDEQSFNQWDNEYLQVQNYNQNFDQIKEIQQNNVMLSANQIEELRENLLQEKLPINEENIQRKQTITQFESKVEENRNMKQIIKTETIKNFTIYERRNEQIDDKDIQKYNMKVVVKDEEQMKEKQQQDQQLAIEWEHNQKELFETGRFIKQFQQRQLIGQGGFGLVYKAFHIFEKKWYAVKQIYIAVNKKERIEDIKEITEVSSMNQLQHPNIVRYHCMWIEDLNQDIKNKFLSNQYQIIHKQQQQSQQSQQSQSQSQSQSQLQTTSQNLININDYGFQWEQPQQLIITTQYQHSSQQEEEEEEEEQSDSFVYDKKKSNNTNFKQSNISFVDELTNNRELLKNIQKNAKDQKVTIVLNIQMQYIDGHTLFDYLKQRKDNYNRTLHFLIFVQLIKGLQYLHSLDIIHRDIKPANIFIDKQQQVKIGDFGLAKNLMGSNILISDQSTEESLKISQQCIHTGVKGTPLYLAPEIENQQNYSKKVDIFSLGLVLLELISEGFGSFHEKKSVFDNIKNGIINQETLKTYNQESLLVLKMTNKDQYKRPSAKEIFESQELQSLQTDLQINQNQLIN